MKINKKKIFLAVKLLLIVYGLIGIAIFYLQNRFLLHPQPLPADHKFSFGHSFEEINIPLSNTDTVNVVRFMPPDDTVAKGAVIYFHGNAGNVECFAGAVDVFLENNYEVWMPDYPGFGKSRGDISEKKLNEEAYQVKRLMNRSFPDSTIIVYGRSFGTGIAAYLASSVKVKKLVLEAPYYSIPELFSSYVPIYPMNAMADFKFPIGAYLKDVDCPITLFHGTEDEVIPVKNSLRLKSALKKNDRLVLVENGKHNDISNTDTYKTVMKQLLH